MAFGQILLDPDSGEKSAAQCQAPNRPSVSSGLDSPRVEAGVILKEAQTSLGAQVGCLLSANLLA